MSYADVGRDRLPAPHTQTWTCPHCHLTFNAAGSLAIDVHRAVQHAKREHLLDAHPDT